MDAKDWLLVILAGLLLAAGVWLFWRERARARQEAAAARTGAEIKTIHGELLDQERAREDAEAWRRFERRFPPD